MNIGLRSWKKEDSQNLSKIINNKSIQDNLRDGLPFPYTESDAETYISATLSADRDKVFSWAIIVDDVVAGNIGVFRKDNIYRLTAEIGYYLSEEYWGKGVMTIAVKLVCEYIFNNTDIVRISADPFAYNDASCRVLEKAGFSHEGTLKNNAVKNGRIIDMKLYAVTKKSEKD